jgi:hypothetical protein
MHSQGSEFPDQAQDTAWCAGRAVREWAMGPWYHLVWFKNRTQKKDFASGMGHFFPSGLFLCW